MIEAKAPYLLTDKYIEMAVWLLNRTPNAKLADMTPHEAVTGNKPDLSYSVPVNAKGYAHLSHEEKPNRHKMDSVAEEVTLLGYSDVDKGSYLVYTRDGKLKTRRNVRFDEFVNDVNTPEANVIDYAEKQWYQGFTNEERIDCDDEETTDPNLIHEMLLHLVKPMS